MPKTCVLGAGSWGTALAIALAQNEHQVALWSNEPEHVADLLQDQENRQFLPGIGLPKQVLPTADLAKALAEAAVVVFAVPSQAVRQVAQKAKAYIEPQAYIISAAKGFENGTLLRMSQVINAECPNPVVALSGPSHAEEVGKLLPVAIVTATPDLALAQAAQELFMSDTFRVYTNSDIIGVEVGAALKNVIALGAGIVDGTKLGDNAKAALMTRGFAEIARLGIAMGGHAGTFYGLAGMGDLIVTCGSMHSRNRRAGIMLGQGIPLDEVLADMGMVVEGVSATQNANLLAKHYQIEMPITAAINGILFQGQKPETSIFQLMTRNKIAE